MRYWYAPSPLPPASVDPDGVMVTDWAADHAAEPPVTSGTVGAALSIIAVAVAVPPAGAQAVALPALSTARNCTQVVPAAVIEIDGPFTGEDQAPAFRERRDW